MLLIDFGSEKYAVPDGLSSVVFNARQAVVQSLQSCSAPDLLSLPPFVLHGAQHSMVPVRRSTCKLNYKIILFLHLVDQITAVFFGGELEFNLDLL